MKYVLYETKGNISVVTLQNGNPDGELVKLPCTTPRTSRDDAGDRDLSTIGG